LQFRAGIARLRRRRAGDGDAACCRLESAGDGSRSARSRRSVRENHESGQGVSGFYTLFYKEWLRFWKVKIQTVLAPVLTALLFLLVFAHTLRSHAAIYPGVEYTAFLVPGLAMMSVLQNSFATSSSSLTPSKMPGNII